ncbi:hypothetical protein [Natronobacterium gregoryi]|uniref:DUF3194 domain-containing protein n=2 Tax=Natronobacterium gregoryi TaxID=44930 RepID=L0AFD8_NATGS|nr:hypothetical protein [Natronobacterium gregoryi]AFZ71862.1 hypothetical protein Natgr_0613 [Natronobacterium gregoryi SP2]ELY73068.1 hypothetical protein C490_01959 [Natronobacterium gregoryi SP2]PLK19379.1 DUF3194 domain-containing protein [Natronobacterium gregoryi SP2]SFJ50519.1 hypothetical protein SAMN05443661_13516 [Natronobacterium gregoryi]
MATDADRDEPSDEAVVQTASEAAEELIFSRYKQSIVRDYDVTAIFEDGVLEVDVYLNAPDEEDGPDPDRVADDAAIAAREAVDELFGE